MRKECHLSFIWHSIYDAPDDFIRLLLELILNCSKVVGEHGRLALHSALLHQASPEQVELILDAYPAALRQEDAYGYLPLHFEALNGGRHEVLEVLLAGYPEGIQKVDNDASLPIHWAVASQSITVESLELLYQAHPSGLLAVNKNGRTALHYACSRNAQKQIISETAISWMIEKCPLLVQAADNVWTFALALCSMPSIVSCARIRPSD